MPTINDRPSDSAIRLGRYEGRVGFSVWRDDSLEGMVLIGIIWDGAGGRRYQARIMGCLRLREMASG